MKYVQPFGLPDYGSGTGQPYVNGDPTIGVEGSIIPAAAVEYPQREIINLVTKATFTPDNNDLAQVTRSVRQQINYAVATYVPGFPNDYSLTLDPVLDSYRPGLTLRVKIPVANTGATTLNINALGTRPIVRSNGAVTAANDLLGNMVVELVYDDAKWQIVNFQGFTSTTTNNNTYIVDIPYVADTGTANHINAPFGGSGVSTTPGKLILVRVAFANTGNVDISVNGTVRPVIRSSQIQLAPGDIVPNMIIVLVYDGASWQMISVSAQQPRIMIGPQSLYVNTTIGNDTNYDGRSATVSGSTGPYKTIGRAITEMLKWTNTGFQFSIFVADGTYEERVVLPVINGSGECHLIGNDANPAAVVIWDNVGSAINTGCIDCRGTNYVIHGFKVQSTNGLGLGAIGGKIDFWNMEFGACGYAQIACVSGVARINGGRVPSRDAKIRISGSSPYHILLYDGNLGVIDYPYDLPDLTISVAVAFSVGFVMAYGASTTILKYRSIVYPTNVVSGKKYDGRENSIISTEGRGFDYLPGPTAGTLVTGAQYT